MVTCDVVILGRGGAGKSTLAQDLSRRIGLPVAELDALFRRPGPSGPTPAEPAAWTARQRELVQRRAWIIDGDLGPYGRDLSATGAAESAQAGGDHGG